MRRFGFLLLFLVAATAFPVNAAEQSGTVNRERVNVRGSASLTSEVVTQLKKDEKVTVLEEITPTSPKPGEPKKWLKIVMPINTPVWVNADYIDTESKKVKPKKLKVRGGAGEQFSMVGVLEQGTVVKQIRVVEGWMEIETPAGAYAFLAADYVTLPKEAAPEPAPLATVPVVTKQVSDEAIVTKPPTTTTTTTAVTETVVKNEVIPPPVAVPVATPPPVAVTPTPAPAPVAEVAQPAAAVNEPPVKRVVSREGILRRARNIQAPTYYSLEEVNSGQIINYLDPAPLKTPITALVGIKVLVTGEEIVDPRWPNMPIIVTENLRLVP